MSSLPVPPSIAKISPHGALSHRQKRRFYIDLSLRRQRSGTGSSHEFLQRRTAMYEWPDLREILKGIPWAIIGGVATRAYMPERATKDLDILIAKRDSKQVQKRLIEAGYVMVSPLAVPGHLFQSPRGAEVDVIYGNYQWLTIALKQTAVDPAGFPVLDLPYLILMKLDAMRPQDWADISRMLGLASDEAITEVRTVVSKYGVQEDLEDLDALIFLGKQEMS